jgi:hypothetical protein
MFTFYEGGRKASSHPYRNTTNMIPGTLFLSSGLIFLCGTAAVFTESLEQREERDSGPAGLWFKGIFLNILFLQCLLIYRANTQQSTIGCIFDSTT